MVGISLRDRLRSYPGVTQDIVAAPSHREDPVEVVWVSDQDVLWTPPLRGVSGMSNWEKTTRQTQDTLERLHLTAGLETPWRPQCSFRGAHGGSLN